MFFFFDLKARGDYRQSSYSDNSISSHPGYSYGPPAQTPSIEYGPPSFGYNYAPYPSSYGAPVHSSYGPVRIIKFAFNIAMCN